MFHNKKSPGLRARSPKPRPLGFKSPSLQLRGRSPSLQLRGRSPLLLRDRRHFQSPIRRRTRDSLFGRTFSSL
jgi:hypothetical protein